MISKWWVFPHRWIRLLDGIWIYSTWMPLQCHVDTYKGVIPTYGAVKSHGLPTYSFHIYICYVMLCYVMLLYCIVLYGMYVCMYVCIHIFICYLHVLFIRVLSQAMVVISQCFFFETVTTAGAYPQRRSLRAPGPAFGLACCEAGSPWGATKHGKIHWKSIKNGGF